MEKDYLIKLSLAVYKVTELFPKEESLKFFLRKKTNQILADSILFFSNNPISLTKEQKNKFSNRILGDVKIIKGYFNVAEKQNWVKEENFLVLKKEYDNIEREIKQEFVVSNVVNEAHSVRPSSEPQPNSSGQEKPVQISFDKIKKGRYKRILEILKEKREAQVRDLKEIFPQISKRTLRRDFDYLLKRGLVERMGDKNRTVYKLKQNVS